MLIDIIIKPNVSLVSNLLTAFMISLFINEHLSVDRHKW